MSSTPKVSSSFYAGVVNEYEKANSSDFLQKKIYKFGEHKSFIFTAINTVKDGWKFRCKTAMNMEII